MTQRRLWTHEQDKIIKQLVKQYGTKKWTTIAQQMKRITNHQQGRSSKQIRQRWHNHLDPYINKREWTHQQEFILFQSHRMSGSKWKQIANKLQGRTDNHVKNYFYSTMRRALRRVNKFLGSKNSTTQMRIIRPSILSYLLDLADEDSEIRSLVSRILELSKCKPNKLTNQSIFADDQKQKYQTAINKLMQINESYTINRTRKLSKTNRGAKSKKQYPMDKITQLKQRCQQSPLRKQEQQCGCCSQKSWQEQESENYSHQIMPQIEKPQYECELLAKKQQNYEPTNHIQFCSDSLWGQHTIQTINLFQF